MRALHKTLISWKNLEKKPAIWGKTEKKRRWKRPGIEDFRLVAFFWVVDQSGAVFLHPKIKKTKPNLGRETSK